MRSGRMAKGTLVIFISNKVFLFIVASGASTEDATQFNFFSGGINFEVFSACITLHFYGRHDVNSLQLVEVEN